MPAGDLGLDDLAPAVAAPGPLAARAPTAASARAATAAVAAPATVAARARTYLLEERAAFPRAVLAAADRVAVPTTEPAPALERELSADAILDGAPAVLEATVRATGRELPADPVAAPPYVVVTPAGLVLRATLSDCRLVITVTTFERTASGWVRGPAAAAAALTVETPPSS